MRIRTVFRFCALTVAVLGTAIADEVTDWNAILLQTLNGPPAVAAPLAPRLAAIVQAAVFDAVNGIEGHYTPVHVAASALLERRSAPRPCKLRMRLWLRCFRVNRSN